MGKDATKQDYMSSIPKTPWWEEKTETSKWSSDFHMGTWHMYKTNKNIVKYKNENKCNYRCSIVDRVVPSM